MRALDLPIVDALTLSPAHRSLLRPGEMIRCREGRQHRLPRFFYRIDSSRVALETQLTEHFALWEFIEVDLHEAPLLRTFPKYVPCGVSLLAAALELLRVEAGAPVRIAANGGYRSPAHRVSAPASPHCWGTAANVYRIGSEYLDSEEKIQRYAALVARAVTGCWVRPSGSDPGFADDHLHLDLGYVTAVPRECSEA
jgi:hypothetical protein